MLEPDQQKIGIEQDHFRITKPDHSKITKIASLLFKPGRSFVLAACAVTSLVGCGGGESNMAAEAVDNIAAEPGSNMSDAIPIVSEPTIGSEPVNDDVQLDNSGSSEDPAVPTVRNPPVSNPLEDDPALVDSPEVLNTVFVPQESDIDDNLAVFQQDGYAEVDVIRINVKTRTVAGICQPDDQSGCTLDDVLADTNASDDFKVDIPIHFSATDFADDGALVNAELRQRGGGARHAPQKSFRLKLDDKDVLWRGERHLQLNKHPFENSRIRNKLAFDLMSDIPHLPSFRSQFVNLWIDDGHGLVDQGLYTHIERGDERYLKRHELDDDGRLYKASLFRFREGDQRDLLLDEEGEPVNESIFETRLEIENGKDHRNLVAMLNALHDPEQSFDSVMERYFNENNVLTWVAVNLLLGQQDAIRHNYYLYNPEDSETFYFLPWDYDSAFQKHTLPTNELTAASLKARLDYGYAIGANNDFLRRYYSRPGAHERILEAAEELRASYLDDATIAARIEQLASVTEPFASALPDIAFNEYYSSNSTEGLKDRVAFNHDAVINHFGIPLPPTLHEPELRDNEWHFTWQRADELTGSELTYKLQLSTSVTFGPDDIVAQFDGIEDTSSQEIEFTVDAARLRSGENYARLFAISDDTPEINWQVANNELELQGNKYYGVVPFVVE